jgi:hypothetical protein
MFQRAPRNSPFADKAPLWNKLKRRRLIDVRCDTDHANIARWAEVWVRLSWSPKQTGSEMPRGTVMIKTGYKSDTPEITSETRAFNTAGVNGFWRNGMSAGIWGETA